MRKVAAKTRTFVKRFLIILVEVDDKVDNDDEDNNFKDFDEPLTFGGYCGCSQCQSCESVKS